MKPWNIEKLGGLLFSQQPVTLHKSQQGLTTHERNLMCITHKSICLAVTQQLAETHEHFDDEAFMSMCGYHKVATNYVVFWECSPHNDAAIT